jgi:hypothetical protein
MKPAILIAAIKTIDFKWFKWIRKIGISKADK